MFTSTENAKEIGFVQTDVVAKLGIENTCGGFARRRTGKIVHGGGQEERSIDVPGQIDDLSAVENGSESSVVVTRDYRHGMG